MKTINQFLAYEKPEFTNFGYDDPALQVAAFAAVASIAFLALLVGLAFYIVNSIFLMKVFKKTGVVEGWMAWIPFLNHWKLLELGGYPGWIALIPLAAIVPVVGWAAAIVAFVFLCLAAYQVGLKFGKSGEWVILFIFVEIVWNGILGLGKAEFNESLGRPMVGSLEGKAAQDTTGSNDPSQNPYS